MSSEQSALTRQLIAEGLRSTVPRIPYDDLSPELRAAVDAYDEARRTSGGRKGEPPMPDTYKAVLAPFIAAAVAAYLNTPGRRVA